MPRTASSLNAFPLKQRGPTKPVNESSEHGLLTCIQSDLMSRLRTLRSAYCQHSDPDVTWWQGRGGRRAEACERGTQSCEDVWTRLLGHGSVGAGRWVQRAGGREERLDERAACVRAPCVRVCMRVMRASLRASLRACVAAYVRACRACVRACVRACGSCACMCVSACVRARRFVRVDPYFEHVSRLGNPVTGARLSRTLP